jgi:hypothetical protein
MKRSDLLQKLYLYLRKLMKLGASDTLILYVNASFAPTIDSKIGELFDNFNSNEQLIINYAIQEAWG